MGNAEKMRSRSYSDYVGPCGLLVDAVVTCMWFLLSPHTFYRLLQMKALYLLPKFKNYWDTNFLLFFTDWCVVVHCLFVLATAIGNLWLLEACIGASLSLAVAGFIFSNKYSCVDYDRFSCSQVHMMPCLTGYALQFGTASSSACQLANSLTSMQASTMLFARNSVGLSALLPVLVCYLLWLACWIVLNFVLFPTRPNLYLLVTEDMGIKAMLPGALQSYSRLIFCIGHFALMGSSFLLVLLGRWAQSFLVMGCLMTMIVRGMREAIEHYVPPSKQA